MCNLPKARDPRLGTCSSRQAYSYSYCFFQPDFSSLWMQRLSKMCKKAGVWLVLDNTYE
jgi:hypothetical protein